jgi:hypothetical protein
LQDTICDDVLTVEEIVQHSFKTLKPESVYPVFGTGDWRHLCVSCIYTQIRDDNDNILPLKADDKGRVVAIYGRVSMMKQRGDKREDGYSIEDQFRYNIRAAVTKGLAFRIYNDAGCSGHWMTADEHLIEEVRITSAELYRDVFTEAFLEGAESWNIPEQIAGMRGYMEQRVRDLRAGKHVVQFSQRQDDEPFYAIQQAFYNRYRKNIHKNPYRPALHALMEDAPNIHSVYVTDHDRLSRNQVLFTVLGNLFRLAEVMVFTSAGKADWITGRDLGSQLLFVVNTNQAAAHIRTTKLRSLIGYKGMLLKGRPHGDIPFWLRRTKNREVEFVPEWLPVIYKMVEFALRRGKDYMSLEKISDGLVELGYMSVTGRRWDETVIARYLENPFLFGCTYTFGREWVMSTPNPEETRRKFPSPFVADEDGKQHNPLAILTKEQAFEMLALRQTHKITRRGRPTREPFLLARIIKCRCGYAMKYEPNRDEPNTKSKLAPVLACNARTRLKRTAGVPHTSLRPTEVVEFFTRLVKERVNLLLHTVEPEKDTETLDEQERKVRTDFAAIRQKKRVEFAQLMKQNGAQEDTPEFQDAVEGMLVAALREQYKTYKESLERFERLREMQRDRQGKKSIAEDIERFDELSAERKNEILQGLIEEVCTKASESEHEYMSITLKSRIELPPVWYHLTPWKDGTQVRHLPTLEEWVGSWQADSME